MKGIEKDIARLQMRHLEPVEAIERIAKEHGVTLAAMLGKNNPSGIGPARRSAIRFLYSCGHDAATIAKIMQRDQSSIQRVLRDERPS